MNIYVGNLPRQTTQDELQEAFEAFGTVDRAVIILDRDTGQSRGFGFVEMPDKAEAEAAIAGMNGTDLGGRTLTVNEAKPREPATAAAVVVASVADALAVVVPVAAAVGGAMIAVMTVAAAGAVAGRTAHSWW